MKTIRKSVKLRRDCERISVGLSGTFLANSDIEITKSWRDSIIPKSRKTSLSFAVVQHAVCL